MKQAVWGLLGIAFGGLMGWLALRSIHWGDVIDAITGANWYLFLLALVAALFAAFLEAWRWKLLLPGEKVSTTRLFLVRNVGMGINNVSPVRIVGEVAQATMLRYGNNVGAARIVSSLLLARMLDMLVTVNIVGIGLIILPQLAGLRPVILPLWILISISLVGFILLGKRVYRIPAIRRLNALNSVFESLTESSVRHRAFASCILITATAWGSVGTAAWLVARATGLDLPFWLMSVVIIAVVTLSSAIPAPPGAVGVYEFAAISTLGLFAVDPSAALTFALVTHGLLFLPAFFIGIPVLATEREALKRVIAVLAASYQSFGRLLSAKVRAR